MSDLVASYGRDAALASTIVLAIGWIAVRWTHSPVHRQRTAEVCIGAALLAGLQAFLPLGVSQSSPGLELGTVMLREISATNELRSLESQTAATSFLAPLPPLPHGLGSAPPTLDGVRSTTKLKWSSLIMVGALAFVLHGTLAWLLLLLTLARARSAPRAICSEAARLLGRAVDVRLQPGHTRPFCCGLWRSMIVLPDTLLAPGLEERTRAVLLHETVHLRRRDPWARALATVAAPFLYWNPLYWWLLRDSQLCSELVADDFAAQAVGKRAYAIELLALAETTNTRFPMVVSGTPVLRRTGDLIVRMKMLFHRKTPLATRSTRIHRAARSTVTAVLLCGVTLALGRAQSLTPLSPQDDASVRAAITSIEAIVRGVESELALGRAQLPTPPSPKDAAKVRAAITSIDAIVRGVASKLAQPALGSAEMRTRVIAIAPGPEELGLFLSAIAAGGKTPHILNEVAIAPNDAQSSELRVELVVPGKPTIHLLEKCAVAAGVRVVAVKVAPVAPTGDDGVRTFTLKAENIEITELISLAATFGKANFVVAPDVRGTITVAFSGVHWREALEASVHALGYQVVDEGSVIRIGRVQ